MGSKLHQMDLKNIKLPVIEPSCFPMENVINADEWITISCRSRRRWSPLSSPVQGSRSARSNSKSNLPHFDGPRDVGDWTQNIPAMSLGYNPVNLGMRSREVFFFHTSPRGDRFLLLSIMEKFYNQVRNMSRKKEQKTPPTTSVQARISLRESWPSYRLRDRQDHKSSTS
jgi:hypothetical protein